MYRLLAVNLLSAVAAAFLCLSSLTHRRRSLFVCQLLECLFLMLAQIVLHQVAAALALAVSAVRNLLILWGHYGRPGMLGCVLLTGVMTAAVSVEGVGWLPVAAALFLAVATCYVRGVAGVRLCLCIALSLWVIYAFAVGDLSTGVSNLTALLCHGISLARYAVGRRRRGGYGGDGATA